MHEGKLKDLGKPKEASLDWKPNAQKCRDRESNPGLIGAKRGRYATLTCLMWHNQGEMNHISVMFDFDFLIEIICPFKVIHFNPNLISIRHQVEETWKYFEDTRARMCCLKTFDSFYFQNVLSNGDGDHGKNDMGQSTNQLSRIYVGVKALDFLLSSPRSSPGLEVFLELMWSPQRCSYSL